MTLQILASSFSFLEGYEDVAGCFLYMNLSSAERKKYADGVGQILKCIIATRLPVRPPGAPLG